MVGKTALVSKYLDPRYNFYLNPPEVGQIPPQLKRLQRNCRRYDLIVTDITSNWLAYQNTNHHPWLRKKWRCPYLADAQGVILAYDVSHEPSLHQLEKWYQWVRRDVPPNTIFCVVGTKADLAQTGRRWVQAAAGKEFAVRVRAAFFCECSARSGENVREPFVRLADLIMSAEPAGVRIETEQRRKRRERIGCSS
ncbi:hypothetical protein VTJ04DRAFT_6096 [Mycothermus thermophilus]|uniref:uncharacterized protein n=1 Tax=Humicola insolens TaxID=85995 RepID=UPI003742106D